ncbi:tRNA (adenine-N(1)-)-methyltransferase non-catalytic subunit [Clonorchis sinensis]|uniref:tRNA (adenine(58)-N(1))-methyltransferase non-catalytic subunit TRM6 n=1 Tax=Clonorchis sinensis TaxID=79923 RepID=H2KSK4_CLOSI|nr:tRNA (adenine-N(1)-)-methyltransferase non-catalytic subunit [Clonorchis sinensis]
MFVTNKFTSSEQLLVLNESGEGVVTSLKSTVAKDNRHIVDSTDNQKLDYEDIRSLRSSGTSGNVSYGHFPNIYPLTQEILTELVRGNANFDKKTKFSQEKYVSKKRKRHLSLFTIEKPCTRILCELYSKLRRDKCLGLRFDTLCHILTYSNVHAGSKVLLAETCAGLLLGGVLERIGPADLGGSVIQFFHGTSPPRPEVNPLAASAYEKQVCAVSLLDVVPLLLGQGTSTELPNKDQVVSIRLLTHSSKSPQK